MTARNHHYVPQWYLRPWGDTKGRVVSSRNGAILPPTNPRNLLAKRDFYAAPTLTLQDVAFISAFIMNQSDPARSMSEAILEGAFFHSMIKALLLQSSHVPEDDRNALTAALIEAEERRLSISEARAKNVVDRLLDGDTSVLRDSEESLSLFEFLGDMYFRTPRSRELGRRIEHLSVGGVVVMTRILGASKACSLFLDRSVMPAALLTNRTTLPFVTSDNPAVNLLQPEEDRVPAEDEYALYLPLAPTHALIIPPWNHTFRHTAATEQLAADLNAWMAACSRETLVARTREDLVAALNSQAPSPPSLRNCFERTASTMPRRGAR